MSSFLSNLMASVGLLRVDEPGDAIVLEILEEERALAEAQDPNATRRVTLSELMARSVHKNAEARERELAAEMGLDVAWKTIFDTAGITTPEHGWTVDRAVAYIRKIGSQGATPAQVRKSLQEAVAADGADIFTIARDAVAKDEILDMYELQLDGQVGEYLEELATDIEQLEEDIAALRQRIASLDEERSSTTRRLTAWKSEKRHLEQQWARVLHIIAPLIDVSDR